MDSLSSPTPSLTLIGRHALIGWLVLVGGCAAQLSHVPSRSAHAPGGEGIYIVRRGDTLYSIAARTGTEVHQLAQWNDLGDGSLIFPGQRLRLADPGNAASSRIAAATRTQGADTAVADQPIVVWNWPTRGSVIAGFGETPMTISGIHIGGERGQAVVASADGEVVYSGTGLIGYGHLVIIKHNSTYLSAYADNDTLLVHEGDKVNAGQAIATMGEGPGQHALLHFEIRKNGRPVNPMSYLPAQP